MRQALYKSTARGYTESMCELLAPAGDMKSFDAAIACGADAVYLGLGDFNARMKAQNFDAENLREAVKRAHFYGAKVYVTINTILQNAEFNKLISLVKVAVSAKVDAFIVQDIGVVSLLREKFPGIVLHVSTQMGIHDLEGAKQAERMGVKRAVLSRETSLEDIRAIRAGTSLELEYFVQGALCVAFSGECYMSSVEQGASGNRGLCKQLCRLPYEARMGDFKRTGYLLSARDLCLADSIKELAMAGVTSFKIEGRMRREGYVAKAVQVYRKILDGAEDKLSEGDKFSLGTAFSRGEYLTRGYLDGGTPSVIEPRTNGHIGVEIGKVAQVRPFKKGLYEISLSLTRPLRDGDGLKFFDGDAEKASLGVGGVKDEGKGRYKFVSATNAKVGWSVRMTLDSAQEERSLSRARYREIALDVVALKGKPLTMRATCDIRDFEHNAVTISAEASSGFPLEEALNAPMSEDMLREQATKTQYAGFAATSCGVQTDNVFVPKSAVNAVRRELLEKLAQKIVAAYEKGNVCQISESSDIKDFDEYPSALPEAKLHTVLSEDICSSVFLKSGELPVLAPSEYTKIEVEKLLSALDLGADEVALKLPPLACGRDIAVINKLLGEVPIKTLVAENIYGLSYAERGYRVIAGAGMNIANSYAALEAVRLGAYGVVPSLEFKDGIRAVPQTDGGNYEANSVESRGENSGVSGGGYAKNEDEAEAVNDAKEGNAEGKLRIWDSFCAPVRVFSSDYRHPLMTLAHCPYKTLFENDCAHCSYRPGLTLSRERHTYAVRRVRLSRCIFELYGNY